MAKDREAPPPAAEEVRDNPAITNINGQDVSDSAAAATLSPPGPWLVQGTVNWANLTAMTFQVVTDTNPVRSIIPLPQQPLSPPPPPAYTNYSFSIPVSDIPGNGQYLLCVTAYYSNGDAPVNSRNLTAVDFPVSPPPIASPPAGQGP
jgi:hypothetical protein